MSLTLEEIHILVSIISVLFLGLMGYLGLYIKDKILNTVTALEIKILNSLTEIRTTQVEIKGEVSGHQKQDDILFNNLDRRIGYLENKR